MEKQTDAEKEQAILDLCLYLQSCSVAVWDRIKYSWASCLRINETTATQNLVFEFWRLARHTDFPIAIYEAQNEKTTGSDIEIAVETEKGYVLIALQAKIIRKNGKYPAIGHKVGLNPQIDLLIRYAKRTGRLAAYLFYNYTTDYDARAAVEDITDTEIETWGCTTASASAIRKEFYNESRKKWKIPHFSMLHPEHAIPLHRLLCGLLHGDAKAILGYFGNDSLNAIKYLSKESLHKDEYWENMLPLGSIGRTRFAAKANQQRSSRQDYGDGFNPKYRIVLSKERVKGGLYEVS